MISMMTVSKTSMRTFLLLLRTPCSPNTLEASSVETTNTLSGQALSKTLTEDIILAK